MDKSFWKGKKVLVTGHTGFKGSWLCLWLQGLGAEVTGYSLQPPTQPSLFQTANVAKGMTSLTADVRDLENLTKTFNERKPQVVMHLAAQSLVRRSYASPVETYATNVMGTVNVLEAARLAGGVRVIVNITSDKCYENKGQQQAFRETDPMGGYDPYSNSKGCAELVTSAFRDSFFNPKDFKTHGTAVATVRAGNVIGGGDWAEDRLVPDIVKAFMEGRPAVIRNPQAVRPWQHVLEPLSGYLALAEKLWQDGAAYAEGWNFGPNENDAKPVSWIVEKMASRWGNGAKWQMDGAAGHPHEAAYLKLDCSKAKSRLGWQPRTSLETALDWIVEWTRQYASKQDMRKISEEQIKKFETMGVQ